MRPHRLCLVSTAVITLAVVLAQNADAASRPIALKLHPREVPDAGSSYPMTSGDYAVLSLGPTVPNGSAYRIIDDRTHKQTRLTTSDGCQMWGTAPLAEPWIVFVCVGGAQFRLYNVETHRWRTFACGAPCQDIGVAAPLAAGSHRLQIDEPAYCDPRYSSCDHTPVYVSLPAARVGGFQPSPGRILALTRHRCRARFAHRYRCRRRLGR